MKKYPFHIQAIVILPDHLHCVCKLPAHDNDFALRWRLIKHFVARGINVPINNRGEKLVWQRRFWEHLIRDENDWRIHVDYIHYNPVKHGYVKRPVDWNVGSFQRAVRKGWYEENWGGTAVLNANANHAQQRRQTIPSILSLAQISHYMCVHKHAEVFTILDIIVIFEKWLQIFICYRETRFASAANEKSDTMKQ